MSAPNHAYRGLTLYSASSILHAKSTTIIANRDLRLWVCGGTEMNESGNKHNPFLKIPITYIPVLLPWVTLLLAPPQNPSVHWNAAQGVACQFKDSQAQCLKASWGFELETVEGLEIESQPVLQSLNTKIHALRDDHMLFVIRGRFINRSDRTMFLEASSIWLRLQGDRPYHPMTIDEIAGLWGNSSFLDSDNGKWCRANMAIDTIYIPPKHFTEKYILFRIPALGWKRIELEVDPLWLGTEINHFRIWAERISTP